MNELSKELQEELKIIEEETDFFLSQPLKPQAINFFSGLLTLTFAVCIIFMIYQNPKSMLPYVFIFILCNSIINFIYQKTLYKNYKTAHNIITYYKKKSSAQT
jgi:hypothetical protein